MIASADYPPLPPSTPRPQTFHRPTYTHHGGSQAGSSGYPSHSTSHNSNNNNKPFSLATLINLTQPLLSGLGQKPPEKAPGIMETLQALNAIKDKLPVFNPGSNSNSMAPHPDTNSNVILEPIHHNKPSTTPAFGPIPVDNAEKPYIPLESTSQTAPQYPTQSIPVMNPLDVSGTPGSNSGSTSSQPDDPWLGSIASAFGSFFGKPPVLPGHSMGSSDSRTHNSIAPHQQRPIPVPIPLNAPPDLNHSLPVELFDSPVSKVM